MTFSRTPLVPMSEAAMVSEALTASGVIATFDWPGTEDTVMSAMRRTPLWKFGQEIRRTADSDLVRARRTVIAMTQIDGRVTRKRFTSNPRAQGNRITYSLVIGWLFWLATGRPNEWLILLVAAVIWTAITLVLVMIDRHRWEQGRPRAVGAWRQPGTERTE
jgi:hypothetical protein